MKLATNSQATYPITLSTGYDAYHAVPNEYTKVATRLAGTDSGQSAAGASLTTTYAAYISKTQPADTYSGKVKYTLVHPYTEPAPVVSMPNVYTLSRADSGIESGTQIGEAIPNNVATYDTPDEAVTAWQQEWGTAKHPLYLGHTVVNDIITESYIGFAITPEEAADSEGMVAGYYFLRSGVDESNLQNKPIFTANKNILKTVYDYSNHPERCGDDTNQNSFYCEDILGPSTTIYSNGYGVTSEGGFHCIVDSYGYSSCEWQ